MAKNEKKDFSQLGNQIVELVGGEENVTTMTHCLTRLRFILKDESKAKTDELKKLDGVINVLKASGQYQVVIGNDVTLVYNEILKSHNIQEDNSGEAVVEDAGDKKSVKYWWNKFLDYVTGTMTQILPVIICAGMISVVLTLLTSVFGMSKDNTTYQIFNYAYNAGFYFLPVYVGFAASKKLKSNPFMGAFMGAVLIHPTYVAMVGAGDPVTLLGLPVKAISYTSTVIPMLLIILVMSQVEKLVYKIMPGALKTTLGPLCEAFIMIPLALWVLGPIGYTVGSGIVKFLLWVYSLSPMLIIPLSAVLWPILVLFGAHTLLVPTMTELIATQGFDNVIKPGAWCSNFAILGVCLAVAVKSKEYRGAALSAATSTLFGITEPSMYGIILPLKKTMISMIGASLIGGVVVAIMGVHNYVIAANSILSIAMFGDTMLGAAVGVVVSVVAGFVLTMVIGFDENVTA